VFEVPLLALVCTVPGKQLPAAVHVIWLIVLENVFGSQAMHVRLLLFVPACRMCSPIAQSFHFEHDVAFATSLYDASSQGTQTRLFVADGAGAPTDSPAAQSAHAMQVVAFAVALKKPVAQGKHARFAPGEPGLFGST